MTITASLDYDCTGKIGQLDATCEWPMYSYERPAWIVWNAIAKNLHRRGWNDNQIKDWLQSKQARWALDGELHDLLQRAADEYATKHIQRFIK